MVNPFCSQNYIIEGTVYFMEWHHGDEFWSGVMEWGHGLEWSRVLSQPVD